jgi:hypothetical protein
MTNRRTSLIAMGMVFAVVVACSQSEDGGSATNANNGSGSKDAGAAEDAPSVLDAGTGDGAILPQDSGTSGCQGDCSEEQTGAGTSDPFTPENNESLNVVTDPSGALVLDRSGSLSPNLIWIANSPQNAVAKVDTTTFQELGRYYSGTGDPSRTSVDAKGDVYVGNRGGQSLTKISALGDKCPDTNGDGVITTSSGPNDLLPFGQDDCVLWQTPLGGDIRGVAAQDITHEVTIDPDLPAQIQVDRYVWAGGLHGKIYKLDGETGEILLTTDSPTPVYGMALDGQGQLWVTGGGGGGNLGRIDTNVCVDDASCNVQVCEVQCVNGDVQNGIYQASCPATCDTTVKQRVLIQDGTYGITVDFQQRVWLGGGSGMKRYDPSAPEATRLTGTMHGFTHGVAADAKGWIWGAATTPVIRMNGDTMENTSLAVPDSKGMAVDRDGKIWVIGREQSAHVIEPGPTLMDANIIPSAVMGLVNPYTYSDMTGLQATLAKNDPGYYREAFEGCEEGAQTTWAELTWDVETPTDTSVTFRIRSAASLAGLETAKWVVAATIPSDVSPAELGPKMAQQGASMERFLEVEVWLSVGAVDPTGLLTPKVKNFGVSFSCPPAVN